MIIPQTTCLHIEYKAARKLKIAHLILQIIQIIFYSEPRYRIKKLYLLKLACFYIKITNHTAFGVFLTQVIDWTTLGLP